MTRRELPRALAAVAGVALRTFRVKSTADILDRDPWRQAVEGAL